VFMNIFKLVASDKRQETGGAGPVAFSHVSDNSVSKVGRNDQCPCGSGRKFKHCGLINTAEHQQNIAKGGAKPKHEVTGG